MAIPTFEGLRRLLFYHGRGMSSRYETFYTYQMYKNQLLVFVTLMANSSSKFSAVSPYLSFYSALYTVLMTNFAGPLYQLADQDVAINELKYTQDSEEEPPLSYDPTKPTPLLEYFTKYIGDPDAQIRARGITPNADGSTNLLPEYFDYCRSKKAYITKILYYILQSVILGVLVFYINENVLDGIVNEQGLTMDFLNVFLCMMLIFCVVYHVFLFMETWNWTGCNSFWYLFSCAMPPLVVWMDDVTPGFDYSHCQFSIVLRSPVYWLNIIICTFIIAVPRYA